jgi:hypothetical protein
MSLSWDPIRNASLRPICSVDVLAEDAVDGLSCTCLMTLTVANAWACPSKRGLAWANESG